ncbi:MAG TPA: membrane protein insertase YidC [Cryptosporangiaceae bacterium]|nr:membrane protein insertase YidC [Cryptosporangiaceae bacterium]
MDLLPLNWAYIGISWILLRWHDLWSALLGPTSGPAWVLSIVFLVITVRVILFPVFVKQIKSQRAMQNLQPQIKELREKHKGDSQALQKETMELYRREKANPLMGCLPIFLQIPVFFGLFHVLRQINPTDAAAKRSLTTEFFWSSSQFDSAAYAKLLGAPIAAAFNSSADFLARLNASGTTVKIVAATLIAIMVVTTYLTQRQMIARNGPATDPTQAMIQKFMLYGIPASLLISGALFPIGVVIYWVTTNLFSMGQQFWVLRKMPPPGAVTKPATDPAVAKALAPKPGVKPSNPKKGGTRTTTAKAPASGAAKTSGSGAAKTSGSGAAKTSGSGAAKAAANGNSKIPPATTTAPAAKSPAKTAKNGAVAGGDEAGKVGAESAESEPAAAATAGKATSATPRRPQDNRNRRRKGGRR